MKIVEVGPRDGLQNESTPLSVEERVNLVRRLVKAGLRHIEVGAFVSPKWVPQMDGSGEVVRRLLDEQASGQIPKGVCFSVLVPNAKGMEAALASGIDHIAVFGAASESFSKSNINCSIDESFNRFHEVVTLAKSKKIKVRGYLSVCFGCPFEGAVPPQRVAKLAKRMLDLGVYEVSIGDTIGVATPKQVMGLLRLLKRKIPVKRLAMHFHDTRGTALANVFASYQLGVRTFDSSIGSLGGCPYAPGASGNLATEDLCYMLHGMGEKTSVDIARLVEIKLWVEKLIGRDLASHVGRVPLDKIFCR